MKPDIQPINRYVAALVAAAGLAVREEAGAYFARRSCYEQSIARAMRDLEADRRLVASLRP